MVVVVIDPCRNVVMFWLVNLYHSYDCSGTTRITTDGVNIPAVAEQQKQQYHIGHHLQCCSCSIVCVHFCTSEAKYRDGFTNGDKNRIFISWWLRWLSNGRLHYSSRPGRSSSSHPTRVDTNNLEHGSGAMFPFVFMCSVKLIMSMQTKNILINVLYYYIIDSYTQH